ncbi:hypothetical protein DPEC_G00254830 [Dallia pectoralis]|uniref:Uncharacterized protein n=1 Tax=Dallia pectoralis TaxID=75939 RepID=A0ACC2FUC7_DALPE|nr:hypothetical protein DPEC_G00254830 [Dallia pectoralis]
MFLCSIPKDEKRGQKEDRRNTPRPNSSCYHTQHGLRKRAYHTAFLSSQTTASLTASYGISIPTARQQEVKGGKTEKGEVADAYFPTAWCWEGPALDCPTLVIRALVVLRPGRRQIE